MADVPAAAAAAAGGAGGAAGAAAAAAGGGEGGAGAGKRFEVKKWNAVALWSWGTFILRFASSLAITHSLSQTGTPTHTRADIVVDNCAICRNHIMDLCTWRRRASTCRRT